jgi:hypothetical protein
LAKEDGMSFWPITQIDEQIVNLLLWWDANIEDLLESTASFGHRAKTNLALFPSN